MLSCNYGVQRFRAIRPLGMLALMRTNNVNYRWRLSYAYTYAYIRKSCKSRQYDALITTLWEKVGLSRGQIITIQVTLLLTALSINKAKIHKDENYVRA